MFVAWTNNQLTKLTSSSLGGGGGLAEERKLVSSKPSKLTRYRGPSSPLAVVVRIRPDLGAHSDLLLLVINKLTHGLKTRYLSPGNPLKEAFSLEYKED